MTEAEVLSRDETCPECGGRAYTERDEDGRVKLLCLMEKRDDDGNYVCSHWEYVDGEEAE